MSVPGPLRTTAVLAALALAILVAGSLLWARGARFGLAAVQQPGPQRCLAVQLALRAGRPGVAEGNTGQVFVLTNRSRAACYLSGFPGMQLVDADGRAVPTRVLRTGAYTFREVPPRPVDLAPGGQASFDAAWANPTGYPGVSCPAGAGVQVTPPDVSGQLTIATGIEACPDGTIHVSPVVAGARGVGAP